MKLIKTTLLITAILFLLIGCNNNGDSLPENNTLEIGDFHEGGVIFYLDSTGEHGLICSITDQGNETYWSGNAEDIPGADGIIIGTGMQNTIDIENGNNTGVASEIAVYLCTQYSINDYDNWFLPSKDELNLISLNKDVINATAITNGGTEFYQRSYWSSTEFDAGHAWKQDINNGEQFTYAKTHYACSVRAIRAF